MISCSYRQNNCRKLTNERMMAHHKTIMYQELSSIDTVIFDANVSRLLYFVRAVANPFIIKASGVRLRNFATEHLINDEIMDVFKNGEKIQTRELVLKTKKLTIHRCSVGGPMIDRFCVVFRILFAFDVKLRNLNYSLFKAYSLIISTNTKNSLIQFGKKNTSSDYLLTQ